MSDFFANIKESASSIMKPMYANDVAECISVEPTPTSERRSLVVEVKHAETTCTSQQQHRQSTFHGVVESSDSLFMAALAGLVAALVVGSRFL
jgi:hypothetical protein